MKGSALRDDTVLRDHVAEMVRLIQSLQSVLHTCDPLRGDMLGQLRKRHRRSITLRKEKDGLESKTKPFETR